MKRSLLLLFALAATRLVTAQQPLYIVNGREVAEIASIAPEEIESIETLPADEETIGRYGERAAEGVVLLTLRYDTPARFTADSLSFGAYIARQVAWSEREPAARVVVRYTVTPEGTAVVDRVLEATDRRLQRRVLRAIGEAPRWEPARKQGRPLATSGVVCIQLPEGKPLVRLPELVIR